MVAMWTFTSSCIVAATLCFGASDKPHSRDVQQDSDDLASLVQLSLQRGPGKERADKPQSVTAELQQNATSEPLLLAQQAPVKSFPGADQIMKFPEWRHDIDLGFRQKLHDLVPRFKSECLRRGFGTEQECETADDELRTLVWATTNVTDENILTGARVRLGLTWFLWQPGPPMSFNLVDMDHNNMLTWKELTDVFGWPTMFIMLPLRKFLDPDDDGNTTRDELYNYLHSSILVRDQMPQVDQVYPEKPTQEVLTQLQRVFFKPHLPEQLNRVAKVLILLGTAVVSVLVVAYFSCGSPARAK
mmetsp:Transcript_40301/g.93725  ORF Transcript_40301/g.93725 Transcript_40301/m.93725 type:complete len:302 (-) Transcript_40301:256-1161(-)